MGHPTRKRVPAPHGETRDPLNSLVENKTFASFDVQSLVLTRNLQKRPTASSLSSHPKPDKSGSNNTFGYSLSGVWFE